MKSLLCVLGAAAMVVAGSPQAQSGQDLLKSKNCLGCHDAQVKKVGPAFKDIAAAKKDPAALTARLKEGKGHPKVAASDAELKSMLDAINATK